MIQSLDSERKPAILSQAPGETEGRAQADGSAGEWK
jgi:hypothetical protein